MVYGVICRIRDCLGDGLTPGAQAFRDGLPVVLTNRVTFFGGGIRKKKKQMGVSKNRGVSPKMDGENNGKPLLKWMIWGENPLFLETPRF